MARTGRTRREVANLLALEARTVSQVASLLRTSDGALRSVVNGMLADEQIQKAQPLVARGQRYELTEHGRAQLVEAAPTLTPGTILPGQRLLLLVNEGRGIPAAAWEALAAERAAVLWAARMDGAGPLLVALDPDDPLAADRLQSRLDAAGMRSLAGRVSGSFGPDELLPALPALG